ncbi:MORN repeat-containing protein 4 homolog isoform X2 [Planococcus citri]|uniref:MORN repeat-containing protein 4 homolog isoform X2 n=1 Tax=Planococcus citri TaxID=170843 RepID=UPI0031F9A393
MASSSKAGSNRVFGAYEYNDHTKYYGQWSKDGLKHGFGHLILPDSTRYDGSFSKGLFNGLGVLRFPDGARYEGEFIHGWFHGYGVFWRADGMKYEGEFSGGKVCGHGLVTYRDGNHGFPRNEGVFMNCRMINRKNCPDVIEKARSMSNSARTLIQQNTKKYHSSK